MGSSDRSQSLLIESPVNGRLTTLRQLGVGPAERLAAEEPKPGRERRGMRALDNDVAVPVDQAVLGLRPIAPKQEDDR